MYCLILIYDSSNEIIIANQTWLKCCPLLKLDSQFVSFKDYSQDFNMLYYMMMQVCKSRKDYNAYGSVDYIIVRY